MSALAALSSLRSRFYPETKTSSGTSVADMREALAYWRGRRSRLPWYRLAARTEAQTMARRWRARLLRANLERWQLGFLERPLAPLLDEPSCGGAACRLGRLLLRRATRLLLTTAAIVALGALATLVLVAVIVGQLI